MSLRLESAEPIYIFCPQCSDKAWIEDNHLKHHEKSDVDHVVIKGVFVVENFITEEEENQLIPLIDSVEPWVPSQEGRAKQDYGPKVSFVRKRAKLGDFHGFPDYANILFKRMQVKYSEVLDNFVPVEFCILEYTPERGSYIRPHYDDKWIWGDRLVTINLLSSTFLRLSREFKIPPYEIFIKMPPRSLLVLYDEARYDWYHSINKHDIKSRRIALTWREFGEEILKDEKYLEFVNEVFSVACRSEVSSSGRCLLNC